MTYDRVYCTVSRRRRKAIQAGAVLSFAHGRTYIPLVSQSADSLYDSMLSSGVSERVRKEEIVFVALTLSLPVQYCITHIM